MVTSRLNLLPPPLLPSIQSKTSRVEKMQIPPFL
jgi:hypothetical protein